MHPIHEISDLTLPIKRKKIIIQNLKEKTMEKIFEETFAKKQKEFNVKIYEKNAKIQHLEQKALSLELCLLFQVLDSFFQVF
jgi:hypothetical protein